MTQPLHRQRAAVTDGEGKSGPSSGAACKRTRQFAIEQTAIR